MQLITNKYQTKLISSLIINKFLDKLKDHNPDAFVIIYGGEPLLRSDLYKIVRHCNDLKLGYTIISNNSPEMEDKLEELLIDVDAIDGYTASIDPLPPDGNSDRHLKSTSGLKKLIQYKDIIKDVVAEITVDSTNIPYLYDLQRLCKRRAMK